MLNADRSAVTHGTQNIQMIATSGFRTASKCTKFVFGRSLQRSPDPLVGLRGPTFKGQERRGEGEKKERGREREGPPLSFANSWIRPCCWDV